MECKGCGKDVKIAVLSGGKEYCESCFRVVAPAILLILKRWNTEYLFCPATGSYLNYGISFYEQCGFKIHKHTHFFSKKAHADVEKFWLLRYFGDRKCPLIRTDYPWIRNAATCGNTLCSR